jgi:hypothetical protein
MFSIYDNVIDPRSWKSSIGMSEADFKTLAVSFELSYKNIYSTSQISKDCKLNSYEKRLFYILYYLKNYPTVDILGLCFGLNRGQAHTYIKQFMIVLKGCLKELKVLPLQDFKGRHEFDELFSDADEIFIDATELRVERPQNAEKQKDRWSGKKKTHTIKSTIICTKTRYIKYVSKTKKGTISDFKLLKENLSKSYWLNKGKKIWVDSGYQGAKDYFRGADIEIPYKKPRKSKENQNPTLTKEQKEYNQFVSRNRVIVENSICGIKKFRILYNVLRSKCEKRENNAIIVCSGLHNFLVMDNQKTRNTA